MAETMQPPFGPAPPTLAGKDLPSFRYPLGDQPRQPFDGGWSKQANADQFAVSEQVAGVLMQLDPGALRELHWHANAAEWGYVIDGHCRTTIVDPSSRSQAADFGPGDVWYFPRGYGHSIQGIGDKPCLFLLAFDNGYFSEFGTFSISDWMATTPPEVLARNFGLPQSAFAAFPKGEVYMATGPVPPPLSDDPAPGSLDGAPLTHRYRFLAQKPRTFPGGTLRVVSQQEFPISTTVTGGILEIKPGGIREMHWHPNAVEWQYYLAGKARMTVFGSHGRARTDDFVAGDVGYVPQGYGHYIENTGEEDLQLLIVFNNATYESISLAAWMAHNTPELLAANFKVPADTFAAFPDGSDLIPG
ncbi:MAG: cupin domain-containing protein [Bauldia litoralis]